MAQDVSVKLNGVEVFGTPGATAPISASSALAGFTVNVGLVSGNVDLVISDANPGPSGVQHSVGKIIVDGTLADDMSRLSILVARNATAFSVSPQSLLSEGLVDFGTTSSAGLEIRDHGSSTHVLRDHTRLALAVTGDVRGEISVGQVFRLQADGIFTGTSYLSGGTVSANIEATATDNTNVTNVIESIPGQPDAVHEYLAAEYIRAGRGVTGTIAAVGGSVDMTDPSHHALRTSSIRRVIMGPSDSPVGIQGNITADNGKIGTIHTTGPLGASAIVGSTPERRVTIRATAGIDEIRAIDYRDADTETDFPKIAKHLDFYADIDSAYGFPRDGLQPMSVPASDSPLKLVQTEGDFHGSIHAANIVATARANPNDPQRPFRDFHSGILIKGVMNAPITVEYVVSKCDILASSFTSPIIIGVMHQGMIIAHGRDAPTPPANDPAPGYIPSIDIGNRVFTPFSSWPPGEAPPYGTFAKGFCGTGRASLIGLAGVLPGVFNQGSPPDWHFGYTPNFWMYGFCGGNVCTFAAQSGAGDSLIRAAQIDSINIKQMRVLDTGNTNDKKIPPRIEANVIGALSVGDIREGIIWSGTYQWDIAGLDLSNAPGPFLSGNPDHPVDPRLCPYVGTNDYASIVSAHVGCIGHWAQVWYQDCPRFVIDRSCLGGLHLPQLNASQTIWIGDSLGQKTPGNEEFCSCVQNNPPLVDMVTQAYFACPDCSSQPCQPFDDGGTLHPTHPQTGLNQSRGLIAIGDHLASAPGDQAIHGQIIINGDNYPLGHLNDDNVYVPTPRWEGKITTGPTHPRIQSGPTPNCDEDDRTPIPDIALKPVDDDALRPTPLPEHLAPYYPATPHDLGNSGPGVGDGGSIGLAPFHLHETACEPPHNFAVPRADRELAVLTDKHFLQLGSQVWIRSYGPVRPQMYQGARRTWQDSVQIQAISDAASTACGWIDVTSLFTVRGPGSSGWTGDDRTIALSSGSALRPLPGTYRVVPLRVVCYDVSGEPSVEWPPDPCDDLDHGSYRFRIAPDCNGNLSNDFLEIQANASLDTDHDGNIDSCQLSQSAKCRADFNHSGMVEVQDIFDFLAAWFAQCTGPGTFPCFETGDFNHSGGFEVQDIFDFLNTWFSAGDLHCH